MHYHIRKSHNFRFGYHAAHDDLKRVLYQSIRNIVLLNRHMDIHEGLKAMQSPQDKEVAAMKVTNPKTAS